MLELGYTLGILEMYFTSTISRSRAPLLFLKMVPDKGSPCQELQQTLQSANLGVAFLFYCTMLYISVFCLC